MSARSLESVLLAEVLLEGLQRYSTGLRDDKEIETQGNYVDLSEDRVGPCRTQVSNHDGEDPGDHCVHQPSAADRKTLSNASNPRWENL